MAGWQKLLQIFLHTERDLLQSIKRAKGELWYKQILFYRNQILDEIGIFRIFFGSATGRLVRWFKQVHQHF